MPVHDWTRLPASVFLHFRLCWLVEIRCEINRSLPADHYALMVPDAFDPDADPANPIAGHRAVAIFHQSSTRRVAVIDVIPPETKLRVEAIEKYARRAIAQVDQGVNAMVIDVFPQVGSSPLRAADAIWFEIASTHLELPAERPLTLSTFSTGPRTQVFLEPLRLGDPLPDMPLFFGADQYIPVSLEPTYISAFEGVPRHFREALTAPATEGGANGT